MRQTLSTILLAILLTLANAWGQKTQEVQEVTSRFASTQQAIERTSLQYFLDHTHPSTGLVRDKADNFRNTPASNRVASIAATGFGLAVITNAALRGQLPLDAVRAQVLRTLQFCIQSVPRYKGWFMHWVDWETGVRAWESEYSPIDTALFVAGALYAAQALQDSEISALTRQIYVEMDYEAIMTNDGNRPGKRTLSMSYSPEKGHTFWQWNMHGEQMILLILGLGHPTKPIPGELWANWNRQYAWHPARWGLMGYNMPLFVHQYSQLFLDLREFNDGHKNYFRNAKRLTALHRRKQDKGDFWGLSAGEAPGNRYKVFQPLSLNRKNKCVGCAVGSAMYMPKEILSDVEEWRTGPYKSKVWGRYGLVDSLDLSKDWFSDMVIGITVGPEYLSLANTSDETSIWKVFQQIPEVQAGLRKAAAQPRTFYFFSF